MSEDSKEDIPISTRPSFKRDNGKEDAVLGRVEQLRETTVVFRIIKHPYTDLSYGGKEIKRVRLSREEFERDFSKAGENGVYSCNPDAFEDIISEAYDEDRVRMRNAHDLNGFGSLEGLA